MSDLIYSIRLFMRELNLNNIAANEFHLHENSEMSQLEFLEYILSEEQRMRTLHYFGAFIPSFLGPLAR